MKVLLDTIIILDVLLDRMPFADAAVDLFSRVEQGAVTGYLCGTSITTVFYLAAKAVGPQRAQEEVRKLLSLFDIAPVTRPVLESAIGAGFPDFEDAVIHEAACHVGVDAIVTRNQKDFKNSRLPVHTAEEMMKILASSR